MIHAICKLLWLSSTFVRQVIILGLHIPALDVHTTFPFPILLKLRETAVLTVQAPTVYTCVFETLNSASGTQCVLYVNFFQKFKQNKDMWLTVGASCGLENMVMSTECYC